MQRSTPMRDTPVDDGHRAKVAATRTASKADPPASTNFEYDDNEWDIGIGDLIIDLDADIEKTNEKVGVAGGAAGTTTAADSGGGMSSATNNTGKTAGGKMAVEHSATVDKGLKMKIKRTKPGTKTSEAKHEIVKTGEVNGSGTEAADGLKGKHPTPASPVVASAAVVNSAAPVQGPANNASKRGSSGHRRDKVREKHGGGGSAGGGDKVVTTKPATPLATPLATAAPTATPDVNGVVRPTPLPAVATPANNPTVVAAPVVTPVPQQRVLFPVGPPVTVPQVPTPVTVSPAVPVVVPTVVQLVPTVPTVVPVVVPALKVEVPTDGEEEVKEVEEAREESATPPPAKKAKTSTDPKDVTDVCVGTSVGTITEPDCLGPCEPGTSVTLEGIVWHETEGGVLVVNVTWRGKTYVGTLLDCTQHDWAPPRFCDSPTSDLDARVPKGRGKRGRAAAAAAAAAASASTNTAGDLSNFTETRSSVHSKLRNGGAKGRRGGGTNGGPSTGGTGSPTPFIPPRPEPNNKRKSRTPDEETTPGKKNKTVMSTSTASGSPPVSPVLLECPEPNCSKKYKHINGLKYHQSHAHGSADDEDTKESLSDNEESNIEVASPAPQVKSPEKVSDRKEEIVAVPSPAAPTIQLPVAEPPVSLPVTPKSVLPSSPLPLPSLPPTTVAPSIPPSLPSAVVATPMPQLPPEPSPAPVQSVPFPSPEVKNVVVKPGVLQFGPPAEEFPGGLFSGNKTTPLATTTPVAANIRGTVTTLTTNLSTNLTTSSQPLPQPQPPIHQHLPTGQVKPIYQPEIQALPSQTSVVKPSQFKVKPTAALMPEEKKDRVKLPGHKKKSRKSPAGSPHPPDQPAFGLEQSGREDVQSPAYSDISDDAAPVLEAEVGDKPKCLEGGDKKVEVIQGPSPHAMSHYNMYPFYGQPPYLVPSVQDGKPKESGSKLMEGKPGDKDKKESINVGEYQQQKLLQQHYYPYGYVPSYPYNMEQSYPLVMPSDEKGKEMSKEDASPSPADLGKVAPPAPSPIQVPNPLKVKGEPGIALKEKQHQNDNHQILKESIEMKNQMSPYLYSRQQQHQQQQQQQQHQQQQQQQHQQQQQQQQQQEDIRRYYLSYPEQQRRKEGPPELPPKLSAPLPKPTLSSPSHKHKDKVPDEKKEEKVVKQEGVKPTMETQGPPPPPTSQYAYIHPSYMQAPHYGGLPFDTGHPMYRSMSPMLVPAPYSGNPYLHHQIPRYHAPEDLSRSPSGPTKALDLLQHHASQYYSSHKIHELQERALKSPTPKAPSSNPSPSGAVGPSPGPPPATGPQGPPTASPGGPGGPAQTNKQTPDDKDNVQRHVHTHMHTHVGLGYPILAGQYPAPYGGKPMVRP